MSANPCVQGLEQRPTKHVALAPLSSFPRSVAADAELFSIIHGARRITRADTRAASAIE